MTRETIQMPTYEQFSNEAKYAMLGEFHEDAPPIKCPECEGDGTEINVYGECNGEIPCEICNGTGEIVESVTVSWDTIKAIYRRAVEVCGPKGEASS